MTAEQFFNDVKTIIKRRWPDTTVPEQSHSVAMDRLDLIEKLIDVYEATSE